MLKRVSIQNFKSLKDVTLDLQKINLLIGPNNSGKTNFLKALEFCLFAIDINKSEQEKLELFGKFIFNPEEPIIKFQLAYQDVLAHGDTDFVDLNISPIRSQLDAVVHLISRSENTAGEKLYALDAKLNNEFVVAQKLRINQNILPDNPRADQYNFIQKFLLEGLVIYKPDPNKFIQPANFSADAINLMGDCSNLISFLFYLNTNHKRAYQRIENDLSNCIGDIVSFSTPPVKVGADSKLGLKFFGKNDENYWADEVSEGVLYFLALLTIINQPIPPKLLLLEEPEKGIHPRRIFEVMQFILGLVEDKDVQVIMTTHSPTVVDMFKDMPESVFIFDKDEEGATHVKNLQRDVIDPETEQSKRLGLEPPHYTDSLGDAWTVGFLGGVPK